MSSFIFWWLRLKHAADKHNGTFFDLCSQRRAFILRVFSFWCDSSAAKHVCDWLISAK